MTDLEMSLIEQRFGQTNEHGCVKTPSDLARYAALLDEVKPDLIIETGTFSGKSALWFSRWAPVLTIDVDRSHVDALTAHMFDHQSTDPARHVVRLTGSSSTAAWPVEVCTQRAAQCERVFVSLDSDHSAAHVIAEMAAYGPLVTVGSYMVVEDTIVRWCPHEMKPEGPYEGSPLDAVDYYRGRDGDSLHIGGCVFDIDFDIENRYATTQFPSGWLKRVA